MNEFMEKAFKEAQKAYDIDEVPVGAVIVKDGRIIAKAHNLREKKCMATAHAEIICIEKACKKLKNWRLDECELYVTLEPCLMCTGAIIQARIKKVFFGAVDPKNGCLQTLRNSMDSNKSEYEYIECNKCSEILKNFFKDLRKKR